MKLLVTVLSLTLAIPAFSMEQFGPMEPRRKAKSEALQKILNAELIENARLGRITKVEDLLFEGADPNVKSVLHAGGNMNKLIILSIMRKQEDIAAELIANGADANAWYEYSSCCKQYKDTPAIALAAQKNLNNTCVLLLEKGADVNAQSRLGETALMHAAQNGNKLLCELLLKRGAELTLQDDEGCTALLHAARKKHQAIYTLLVQNGANPKAEDKMGRSAESYMNEVAKKNSGYGCAIL